MYSPEPKEVHSPGLPRFWRTHSPAQGVYHVHTVWTPMGNTLEGAREGRERQPPPPPQVNEGPNKSAKFGKVAKNQTFGCSTDSKVPCEME